MWQQKNNALCREFAFTNFKEALVFVNQVGELAERTNHHPDIELGWGRVKVTLTSHDVGTATERDYKLAKQIDQIKRPSE